jgi:hypothetical protein
VPHGRRGRRDVLSRNAARNLLLARRQIQSTILPRSKRSARPAGRAIWTSEHSPSSSPCGRPEATPRRPDGCAAHQCCRRYASGNRCRATLNQPTKSYAYGRLGATLVESLRSAAPSQALSPTSLRSAVLRRITRSNAQLVAIALVMNAARRGPSRSACSARRHWVRTIKDCSNRQAPFGGDDAALFTRPPRASRAGWECRQEGVEERLAHWRQAMRVGSHLECDRVCCRCRWQGV